MDDKAVTFLNDTESYFSIIDNFWIFKDFQTDSDLCLYF